MIFFRKWTLARTFKTAVQALRRELQPLMDFLSAGISAARASITQILDEI